MQPKKDDQPAQTAGRPGEEVEASGHPQQGRKIPVSVMDKRRVSKDGDGLEAPEPSTKPHYVEQLEGRVKRVEAAYRDRVQELEEEARKSRERLLKDLEKRYQEKERALLLEVVGLLDDLDRARALTSSVPSVAEGLGVIGAKVDQFLKMHGLEVIRPMGEAFDPEGMEAMATREGPEGQVVDVVEPGYRQGETLLRPSRVVVGRGCGGPSAG